MSEFYPFAPRESQLEEYREDARRSFSRIGWACFAMMLVMQGGAALLMLGCQLLAMRGSRFMIAFIQSEWFQWVITDAANYGLGLPVLPTYVICVLGNMLPVPFIYLFARRFLIWGYHKPVIGPICRFFIVKGEKGGRKLEEKAGKGLTVALLLFVGIPLPGTGAWTGTLAASILDMKFKDVLIACMGGVLLAGIIMGLASMGVLGAASSLFAV